MLKFSAVSQIWKKYIQKLNDWDLPLTSLLKPTIVHIKREDFLMTLPVCDYHKT